MKLSLSFSLLITLLTFPLKPTLAWLVPEYLDEGLYLVQHSDEQGKLLETPIITKVNQAQIKIQRSDAVEEQAEHDDDDGITGPTKDLDNVQDPSPDTSHRPQKRSPFNPANQPARYKMPPKPLYVPKPRIPPARTNSTWEYQPRIPLPIDEYSCQYNTRVLPLTSYFEARDSLLSYCDTWGVAPDTRHFAVAVSGDALVYVCNLHKEKINYCQREEYTWAEMYALDKNCGLLVPGWVRSDDVKKIYGRGWKGQRVCEGVMGKVSWTGMPDMVPGAVGCEGEGCEKKKKDEVKGAVGEKIPSKPEEPKGQVKEGWKRPSKADLEFLAEKPLEEPAPKESVGPADPPTPETIAKPGVEEPTKAALVQSTQVPPAESSKAVIDQPVPKESVKPVDATPEKSAKPTVDEPMTTAALVQSTQSPPAQPANTTTAEDTAKAQQAQSDKEEAMIRKVIKEWFANQEKNAPGRLHLPLPPNQPIRPENTEESIRLMLADIARKKKEIYSKGAKEEAKAEEDRKKLEEKRKARMKKAGLGKSGGSDEFLRYGIHHYLPAEWWNRDGFKTSTLTAARTLSTLAVEEKNGGGSNKNEVASKRVKHLNEEKSSKGDEKKKEENKKSK